MQFGLNLGAATNGATAGPERIRALVRTAEEVGIHSVWVPDHIVIPAHATTPYPYSLPRSYFTTGQQPDYKASYRCNYDLLATLPYIAGLTERIRLGTSVLIAPYRNPLVSGKWIATLDQLSRGRLIVGVGIGWLAEEFEALAAPPFAERGRVTDEYIRIWKALWSGETPSFTGHYYRFGPVLAEPRPLQQPHPPIYIGGHSKAALRRAVELGDGWQAIRLEPDELGRSIETLRALAQERGRNPDELTISVAVTLDFTERPSAQPRPGWQIDGDTAAIIAACERYRALGVDLLIIRQRVDSPLEEQQATLRRFAAEVMPAFA